MKPFVSILGLLLILALTVNDASARSAPLVEKVLKFDDQSKQTENRVHDYLLAGLKRYDSDLTYKIASDTLGVLQVDFNEEAELYFTVEFTYDNQEVRTKYVSSKDFSYRESDQKRFIHPAYMEWMEGILAEVKFASALQLDARGEPTHPEAVARITLIPSNAPIGAQYSMSEPDKKCGSFEDLGTVYQVSEADMEVRRKANAEWFEKRKTDSSYKPDWKPFGLLKGSITLYSLPGVPIQFRGSYAHVNAAYGLTQCAPPDVGLMPLAGKKYTVQYLYSANQGRHGTCGLVIFDDTVPEQRTMAPSEALDCKKK